MKQKNNDESASQKRGYLELVKKKRLAFPACGFFNVANLTNSSTTSGEEERKL